MKYSHIIWTTYDSWMPHERRGNWSGLAALYSEVSNDFKVGFSKPLCETYVANQRPTQVRLSKDEQEVAKESLLGLVATDRVAGGLKVLAMGVDSSEVHLLVGGSLEENKQKLSRLKSRSATLLGMNNRSTINNSSTHTWSKGIWAAEFSAHEDVLRIKAYINQLCS